VGTPLCPRGFKTAWADKIPAHPTRLKLKREKIQPILDIFAETVAKTSV